MTMRINVSLGSGFDSTRGAPRGSAVIVTNPTVTGGLSRIICRICTTLDDVLSTFELSQQLTAELPLPFSNLQLSARAKFVSSLSMSESDLIVAVYCRRIHAVLAEGDVQLRDNVSAPDRIPPASARGTQEFDEFFTRHGDTYVSSTTQGAEYCAALVLHCRTTTERREVEVALESRVSLNPGVNLGVKGLAQLKDVHAKTNIRWTLCQDILGVERPEFAFNVVPTVETVIQNVQVFQKAKLMPCTLDFELTGYEQVSALTPSFQHFAAKRSAIQGLRKKLDRIVELEIKCKRILDTYAFYGGFRDSEVEATHEACIKALQKVRTFLDSFSSEASQVVNENDMRNCLGGWLEKGSPSLCYSTATSEEFGPREGKTFFDYAPGFVESRTRVSKVEVVSDSRIRRFSVTFKSEDDGVERTAHHGSESVRHGPAQVFDFRSPNSLSSLGGTISRPRNPLRGERIASLRFGVRQAGWTDSSSAGSNVPGTKTFEYQLQENQHVCGFRGYTKGGDLRQIQIQYISFSPAQWSGAVRNEAKPDEETISACAPVYHYLEKAMGELIVSPFHIVGILVFCAIVGLASLLFVAMEQGAADL